MDPILLDQFDINLPLFPDFFSVSRSEDSFEVTTETPNDGTAVQPREKPAPTTARRSQKQLLACLNCRPKKIKCVREQGSCSRCKKLGLQCILPDGDARSKPQTKSHIRTLEKRLRTFEAELEQAMAQIDRKAPSTPRTSLQDTALIEEESQMDCLSTPKSTHLVGPKIAPTTSPVLQGPLQLFRDERGHLRLFGPTSTMLMAAVQPIEIPGWQRLLAPPDDHRMTEEIPQHLQDYLLDHYWRYQNTILQVIHKDAFLEDMKAGRNRYYSKALLYAIFACAARTSCHPEVRRLAFLADESCSKAEPYFLRKATSLLEDEINDAGITTVQCLQLLSLVHCCRSNHTKGWLESGRAIRLSFELGLHRDPSDFQVQQLKLSEVDMEVRRVVFWGCFEYDRLWSLYLGRPYSIKLDDITVQKPGPSTGSMYLSAAWINLLEILGNISDALNANTVVPDRVAVLEAQLMTWKAQLEQGFHDEAADSAAGCILHLQYCSAVILLHRPNTKFGVSSSESLTSATVQESRSLSVQNAIQIVDMVQDYERQQGSVNTMLGTVMWNITLAAMTLIAGQAQRQPGSSAPSYYHYVQTCIRLLKELSCTYNIARTIRRQLKASLQKYCKQYTPTDAEVIRDASQSIQSSFPDIDMVDPNAPYPMFRWSRMPSLERQMIAELDFPTDVLHQ